MAGRTAVDTPLIGWLLALNEGMRVRSWSFRSPVPRLTRSAADSTSTGTADSVALRGCAREPTTTASSVNPASSRSISAGDNPSASISAGVVPRARASSSTSRSVRPSACSCATPSRGPAAAADAGSVDAGMSTASSRTIRRSVSLVPGLGLSSVQPVVLGPAEEHVGLASEKVDPRPTGKRHPNGWGERGWTRFPGHRRLQRSLQPPRSPQTTLPATSSSPVTDDGKSQRPCAGRRGRRLQMHVLDGAVPGDPPALDGVVVIHRPHAAGGDQRVARRLHVAGRVDAA